MRKILKIFLTLFVLSIFLPALSVPASAAGATLFLAPGSGTYTVNKSFTVKVSVDSGGGAGINAAEGLIKFDPAILKVAKLNNSNSIFKLWTVDPTYSNGNGTISYGGGAPGAYKGTAGEIFSITFTPQKEGTASVTWSSGIVLAADGKGTNIFSDFGNGTYVIKAPAAKEEKKKKDEPKDEPTGILPPLPEVSSASHPKKDIWYSNNEPEFGWKILSDLTGVSYAITNEPDSDPGSRSDGIIETTKYDPQEDGEWYFHIKYQNRSGWGQIAHRKLLIDVTPPQDFTIALDNGGDTTNPRPKLRFKTQDLTSGIDHFLLINGIESTEVSPTEVASGYYQLQPLAPAQYEISIAAIDRAGNTASSSIRFIVEPLKAPIITSIPKIIDKREDLIIRGTSFYPRATIKLYISKENEDAQEYSVSTDEEGNWSYFYKGKLNKGNYEVWAKLIDDRGAMSLDGTKHLMTVVAPSVTAVYGWLIILILILIIIILLLYILYQRKEFIVEKKRILSETVEVKSKLTRIFAALREEVDELIELADKKPGLSESERRVKEKLQESLDISEEFIAKEVDDVEKEIKLKKKNEAK